MLQFILALHEIHVVISMLDMYLVKIYHILLPLLSCCLVETNRVVNLPYSSQHFRCKGVAERAFAYCRLTLPALFEIILKLVPGMTVILGERCN